MPDDLFDYIAAWAIIVILLVLFQFSTFVDDPIDEDLDEM